MHNSSILVLLYGKECHESKTLQELKGINLHGSKVIIWNNGPQPLVDKSIKLDNADVEFIETIDNISLARVYNDFIAKNISKNYILLDDDSNINRDYIEKAISVKDYNIGVPKILFNGAVVGPKINNEIISSKKNIDNKYFINAIGSGVVIGRKAIDKMKMHYGNVFDERFFLYGIDTTFFIRLQKLKLNNSVEILPEIEHSLSRLENESEEKVFFRNKERSYSFGLIVRHYNMFSFYRTFIITLLKSFFNKSPLRIDYVLKAILSGKHYRG